MAFEEFEIEVYDKEADDLGIKRTYNTVRAKINLSEVSHYFLSLDSETDFEGVMVHCRSGHSLWLRLSFDKFDEIMKKHELANS